MTVVAEFTVPPDALPGGEVLTELPDATVELERIVPTNGRILPFFWVVGVDPQRFLERAGTDPSVETIEILETVDGSALVQATWSQDSPVVAGLERLEATIMTATGTAEGWRFRVRAETREELTAFQRIFADQGVAVQLERIFNLSEVAATERPLTAEQHETLLVAFREGYFDQPRGITQAELAERFGVSARAISNRLRRALRNLVASTLVEPGGGTDRDDPY